SSPGRRLSRRDGNGRAGACGRRQVRPRGAGIDEAERPSAASEIALPTFRFMAPWVRRLAPGCARRQLLSGCPLTLGPFAIAVVAVAVLGSSFISGIFGMAGGMILLGVLLVFMDVATAMVLFGVIQMVSNSWRAALWFHYVDWGIVRRFLIGSTV